MTWSGSGRLVERLVAQLCDPATAIAAASLARHEPRAAQPGLYAWWVDAAGAEVLADRLGERPPNPIYAGQAGATRWPSGTSSDATLASRISTHHLGGNIASSTFRRTLAAVLRAPLGLALTESGRLASHSNQQLSQWIRRHLAVSLAAHPDRDTLEAVEADVLDAIDPPLNLRGRPATPLRARLTELRVELSDPPRRG